jgi:2-polyprenyl-3-methyl-5-hydroxy-6-metoxy-1,4-benzoquinol methylase
MVLKEGMRVLDVGAGKKGLKEEIDRLGIVIEYASLDTDTSIEHQFYDLKEVQERFDVVCLFEVIEHLELEDGAQLLANLREKLNDRGMLIVSVPNVFNPSRFAMDASHKTFYSYEEISGLTEMAGFETKRIYRSFNAPLHRYIMKVYIFGFLFRFLSIDYAKSIYVVAQKS